MMNDTILKPKNLEQLEKLIIYKKNMFDKNTEEYNQFLKWETWFNLNKNEIKIKLEEEQYLRINYNLNNEYSLQVWKEQDEYDIIDYVLMANYIDEFCNNITFITKEQDI